jgi:collagenase-like PrtC family protease
VAQAGRKAILSTLTLIEAESELSTLTRLCENGDLLVEANDMAAVELLRDRHLPFVGGPALNLYNLPALERMQSAGMVRWVPPVEYDRDSLRTILGELDESGLGERVAVEVFSHGRLPLAWSARCFTARAHNLPKDDCRFTCLEYPDGLALETRDGEAFLTINGIQTQSAAVCNLLGAWREMAAMGVDAMRISPSARGTEEVVRRFRGVLDGNAVTAPPEVECNGYWYGRPGMEVVSSG